LLPAMLSPSYCLCLAGIERHLSKSQHDYIIEQPYWLNNNQNLLPDAKSIRLIAGAH